eukprot:tig00020723_g13479.t1
MNYLTRTFDGEIFVVDRVGAQAFNARDWLYDEMSQDNAFEIGLDLEWVADQNKGDDNPPALIQTATQRFCVLWRVCMTRYELPHALRDILMDGQVRKIGFNSQADAAKLATHYHITPQNFKQIQLKNGSNGKPMGLSAACQSLLGFGVADLRTLMRSPEPDYMLHRYWGIPELTHEQKLYAATDAWAALQLWRHPSYDIHRHNYV